MTEQELAPYVGKVLTVEYVREDMGRKIPSHTEGRLTEISNGLALFDCILKPGEAYSGFNLLVRTLRSVSIKQPA